MSEPIQKKITSFNNIVIGAGARFTSGTFLNSSSDVITLPAEAGTLATVAEVNAQRDRINRLLDYLESWIGVGNVNMDDIKEEVDPSEPEGEGEGEEEP